MTTFKRAIALVAIVAIFGGSSLGLGLSLGYTIGRNHIPPAVVHIAPVVGEDAILGEEEPVMFTFADQQEETVPLEIRVSDISGVVQTISGSVVSINIAVPSANFFMPIYSPGSGSGIIFAKNDDYIFIATNNHVVERASHITISLDDEYEVEATFINGNWDADLAVLSVPRDSLEGKEYHIAVFGDSDQMRVGDEVIAIGNPMGQGQTATRGIVSAINREITIDGRTLNVLQTDAAINPGNSGGALANIRGEVIGINTAKAISFNIEGMGYAIPSNEALSILEGLLEAATTPRPFLGITHQPIDERTRRQFALPSVGIMIMSVLPNSAAYEAGLVEWDLIVGFDGIVIESVEDLALALSQSTVGEESILQIYRNGIEAMEVSVIIGDFNAR